MLELRTCTDDTLARMTVTFTSCTNSNISNTIEVGFQYLRIAKNFISECIQTIQSYFNISCCDPILLKENETREILDNSLLGNVFLTCSSELCSKLMALGRPSKDEKATLPSRSGDMSLYSLVQRARDSFSPFLTDKKSGKP